MRTTVVTSQFPSFKLALPAVTICQGNLVAVEKLIPFINKEKRLLMPSNLTVDDFVYTVRYLREIIHPTNQYPEELTKLQRILDLNHLSLIQLLELISPTCSDILLYCIYEGQNESCEKLFKPIITYYGICCSFNDASHLENATSINPDIFSMNYGTRYILSILLKSYEDSATLASITYGDGYKIIIHEKYTVPGFNSLEFMAGSALETIVGLRGTYLTSSPEILALPCSKRQCRKTRTKKLYRAENCYMNYWNLAVLRRCDCLPFYANIVGDESTFCNLTAIPCLSCMSEVYSLLSHDYGDDCLPDCEATIYTISITGQPFDALQFKPGKFYRKALDSPNSTALHITFGEQTAVLKRKELILSRINLVSSLGGVFSLFLGCSFISIIEIFYFFYQLLKKLATGYNNYSPVLNSK